MTPVLAREVVCGLATDDSVGRRVPIGRGLVAQRRIVELPNRRPTILAPEIVLLSDRGIGAPIDATCIAPADFAAASAELYWWEGKPVGAFCPTHLQAAVGMIMAWFEAMAPAVTP